MSKILILNGSPREKGNTEGLIKAFTRGAEEAGNTVTEFFLSRIEQLNARLYRNSKVQQGRNPEEDPAELISELDGCIARLEYLIAKINICNCHTKTPDGKSITELIAKRDCLKIKIDAYRDLAGNASSLCDRVTRSEIVILSTVDVRALQKQIDAMSRELRCTDNMIQQLNWLTEIE